MRISHQGATGRSIYMHLLSPVDPAARARELLEGLRILLTNLGLLQFLLMQATYWESSHSLQQQGHH
jgi:hypothetical protein